MSENTIFIGGSRHVSRLPAEIKHRLDNVINSGHRVVVGDANGADKAVQKYFHDASYDKVTVFCSGESFRNNLGHWETRTVDAPKNLKGFQFYAAKDREMAREADFGLMIWDGKSPGTVLNVLRLVRAGKIAVLFSLPDKRAFNIKKQADWDNFLSQLSGELLDDLRERATPEEWLPDRQPSLLDTSSVESKTSSEPKAEQTLATVSEVSEDELAASLNAALAAADPAAVVDALGGLAKIHGMSNVAKETGLARESLYRALSSEGNPEFATVLKVLSSLGLRLSATPTLTASK
jgi:probable addiction module antidote protein